MGIQNISFDKARIFNKQIIFTEYNKGKTFLKVFDANGNNIVNRISYAPVRAFEGDKVIISQKKQYELPSKTIIYEEIKKIYDKTGRLISRQKTVL